MKLLNVFVVLVLGVVSFNSSAVIKAYYRCEAVAVNKVIDPKLNTFEESRYEIMENFITVTDEGYEIDAGGIYDKKLIFKNMDQPIVTGGPSMAEGPMMTMIQDNTDPGHVKFAVFTFNTDIKGKDAKFHIEHMKSLTSFADCLPSE